ncbi:hypothetical protein K2Z83_12215 [Oscillochloris sp. ZM17-4]|uniref:general stress protein n=1 Tax=Oscillochloris sp. ZM17-4 TaxID=2866714 RepID=UPI001C72EC84|nr:general stress protein [Oscillochloris sp. ZM17-4]MBX0328441.1 hypothetical protein [Oscillochloris sp. ZM17-4]
MNQSTIGTYATLDAAEQAVHTLGEGGFPIRQVSILSQDMQSERVVHGYITAGDVAKQGAGVGAWTGGLFGILMGAAFIWVPGFGPLLVAGAFAGVLLGGIEGAAVGAATGGALGALAGWGVSKQHILKYEEQLKAGKYLVIAHGSDAEVAQARTLLGQTDAAALDVHA